jgi:hypothetical protein
MSNVSRPVVCLRSASFVLSLLLLASTVAPCGAWAQTTDVIGVRAQGMGGAFTAVADDATASWWNPAGLAGGAFFNALIEVDRPDTSTSDSVRGVAISYPALGLTYYRLPLRQIRESTSTGSSATSRQQDAGVLSLYAVTVGQSFGNHLVLGSTLKLLRAGDTNVGLDVGAMATFGPARVGVVLRDVTAPSFGNGESAFTLERHARAGAALSSGRRAVIGSATLSFDADLTTTHDPLFGDERMVSVGAEAWGPKKNVALRGGVGVNTAADQPIRLSGGVSFAVRSGTFVDAYVAGGHDEARRGWGFALRVTF